METNAILDQVEQRGVASRAQRLATETQAVETAREAIGPRNYEGAKARLPLIEKAISARFRPALQRVSALAAAHSRTPLPARVRNWYTELDQLCVTVPQQIRTGLSGYEGLVYPHLVNPAIPAAAIIGGTRTLLQGSDGMLAYMDTLLANILAFLTEGSWPPVHAGAPMMAHDTKSGLDVNEFVKAGTE